MIGIFTSSTGRGLKLLSFIAPRPLLGFLLVDNGHKDARILCEYLPLRREGATFKYVPKPLRQTLVLYIQHIVHILLAFIPTRILHTIK